jgi:hypothetical protein
MAEFDEETANRAVAELAATTDASLVVAIRDTMETLAAAWSTYRASAEYPARASVARPLADQRDEAVREALRAVRALGPDDDLRATTRAADPALGAYWPSGTDTERALSNLVDRLRYESKTRPRLVSDARWLNRGSGW